MSPVAPLPIEDPPCPLCDGLQVWRQLGPMDHVRWCPDCSASNGMHYPPAADTDAATVGLRKLGLQERLTTLRDLGALPEVAKRWPAGIKPLKDPDARHTAAQLDKVDALLVAIEKQARAPFGPLDPAHAITNASS